MRDLASGQERRLPVAAGPMVCCETDPDPTELALSPEGHWLVYTDRDVLHLLDLRTATSLADAEPVAIGVPDDPTVWSPVWTADGLVVAASDSGLRAFDPATGSATA